MNSPLIRRSNFLPKEIKDYPCFLFIITMIPVTYWFEMWVVLPSLFSFYSFSYWCLFLLGHFILHNVIGNLLGILMFDTSIKGRKMPTEDMPGARYCSHCSTFTPPRSFHCSSCGTCILKRDHHCIFTSCCIGFFNHRFFFYFLFYIMLATILSTPFNVYFVRNYLSLANLNLMFSLLCPIGMLLLNFHSGLVFDMGPFYLMISSINFGALIFCSVWFYFHLKLILKGTVTYEMKKSVTLYNLGQRKNLEMVFGKRWKLTWITPFLNSPLPSDGTSFPVFENFKNK